MRDSQSVLQRAVQAVREANIPDGALPKVCISGCTSSCSGHQAAAIGFQGTVKAVPGGKPAPAFAIFLGGSDALGHAHFGDTIGTVYEEQLPALLVELGQAAAAAGQNWQTWSAADPDAVNSIIAKYV